MRRFLLDERGAASLTGLAIACAIIITVAVAVSAMLTYSSPDSCNSAIRASKAAIVSPS
jgi:hypothetical protein